ncbi:PLP-dependent aminotransferase family protein [Paenibacillus sp. GSMTC-2017]|nr:PLP-dependent aminotransferase family protein [Paenibacillus sp. GSMTC-2017]
MYGILIEKSSSLSVTRQICQQLRDLIESGQLTAGTRLLPTRELAKDWGIARNVVIEVYEQLTAEGYLDCRVGSGTYVAEGIVSTASLKINPTVLDFKDEQDTTITQQDIIDFATGIPDIDLFPKNSWAKYLKDAAETDYNVDYGYGDIQGDKKLRVAIRDYLYRAKGIICSSNQVMIVSGASEGISLIAQTLSNKFHSVYLEDPTIHFTRDIFQMMNYDIKPVDVDQNGMIVDSLPKLEDGHLLLLTPSHQFPTGSLLSIQRRQLAIHLADQYDSYVIEDDYDSEFRLKGIPVPPLQTLSPNRVIYVGTFSKTLSPSLRIGFIIIPSHLIDAFATMKCKLNMYTSLNIQRALSQFILDGQYERHIHSMKKVYKKRRNLLIDRLTHTFGNHISISGDDAGMHLQVQFQTKQYSNLPWNDTGSYGFRVEHSDDYKKSERPYQAGIILGYGNLHTDKIEEGVRRVHRFIMEKTNH